ncbi:hypothetical protein GPECTOR_119g401 [Gonium pectorale]|uniref:Uncharacterized protein n=1 Tax=Gonium pectorale TaxID=33097 RepID=A0A150G0C7_GONPE|nr:hypothetical protein GPECTOR_119g401 [Gonium pectorale]|eukprot:KXZ42770.1 hypothetical protein GPECTOR_119g401 [Gonium pectorale]
MESLKQLIEFKEGVGMRSVSVLNCGVQGDFGAVWQTYLSGVQMVNLSGNALTGDFTTIDSFDSVCTPDFAGDDYADPDCTSASIYVLDVSRNALAGTVSTGAALGDDITDAVCSTGCISLVMAPGIMRPEVLCMAPLVVYALDNPALRFRDGARFASGYVVGDPTNWCFQPASRWVLPVMWSVFLVMLAGTLAITLYARLRLKRVPFRMQPPPSFDVLARGPEVGPLPVPGTLSKRASAAAISSYASLPGDAGAVEMAERQAMIPKSSGAARNLGLVFGEAASYGGAGETGGAMLPVSTVPADAQDPTSAARAARKGRPGRADPEGMRVALTAGLAGSSPGPSGTFDLEASGPDELEDPGPRGATLGSRAAAAAAGGRASEGGRRGGGEEEGSWRAWFRAVLSRALDILWMELRTLLILGMFGLECYWAYSLILYRGGWQLLVLIPNYVEHTLAGIAMLRAFMAGTHGRWKYVAPVPLLPFSMASVYLVYGFFAYPFGWADFGPVSWEKFIDLMDSCGVLSSTCWAIFSSLAYWQGNSVSTSYQYFNTDIFVGMMLMCFTDLLSTAHHLASTLQVPFKQWLRKELDVRLIKVEVDKSHRLVAGDGDL